VDCDGQRSRIATFLGHHIAQLGETDERDTQFGEVMM
jgi:hypothetical protein